MPSAPPPVCVEIGDVVGLIGRRPRFIIREILPDGKHAVCERAVAGSRAFVAVPSSYYSSYILALVDLEKCAREGKSSNAPGQTD
jgi:hypothetical protein